MAPEIIIQLVLYHDSPFLPGLLKSLKIQTFEDYMVIALDNSRDEESSLKFRELCPRGELFRASENLGFAGGHNFLLQHSLEKGARFIVVLNTDVQVHKDFLKHLRDQMIRFPGIDACGPLIYAGEGTKRTKRVQNFRLFMNFPFARKSSPDAGIFLHTCKKLPLFADVDYLSGVAMMIRSEIFDELSLWDEDLFLYGEERDFFCRFAKSGRLAMVTRKAVCWHFHDWSVGNTYSYCREYYYLCRNKVLYFRKYNYKAGLLHFLVEEFVKLPVTFLWAFRKGGLKMFRYYCLGIWHGLQGRTGRFDRF
jgi:GT2 family glycosyltransferase